MAERKNYRNEESNVGKILQMLPKDKILLSRVRAASDLNFSNKIAPNDKLKDTNVKRCENTIIKVEIQSLC